MKFKLAGACLRKIETHKKVDKSIVTDVTFSRIYKKKQMLVEFLKECDMNSDRKL